MMTHRRPPLWEYASLCLSLVLIFAPGSNALGQLSEIQVDVPTSATPAAVIFHNPPKAIAARPGADPALPETPAPIRELIHQGKFSQAIQALEAMRKNQDRPTRFSEQALNWQIEKLRRIKGDYEKTRADVLPSLRKKIRDFQDAELDGWIAKGLVDCMMIDGEEHFAGPTASNLFFLSPEIRKRKIGVDEAGRRQEAYVLREVKRLKKAAMEKNASMLSSIRWQVEMTIKSTPPPERNGHLMRAWMPFVRSFPFQTDINLERTAPKAVEIAMPEAPQRTIYFEQTARGDTPASFTSIYEYTAWARVNLLNPGKITTLDPNSPVRREFAQEEPPHVRFTPEMRKLQMEIAGDDRNPARSARKIYEWISENIRYSYAREYSTLDDIALYTAERRAGDCGQEALLLITLCRLSGIPARWQSAWTCYPDWEGMHDWTEIYIAPYGWIPVDPYMGIWAMQYAETFTDEEKREVRNFYFGNMDAHRMAANAAHAAPFQPAKKGFRSDSVDSQRGELEWSDGENIYFSGFDYDMKFKRISEDRDAVRPPESDVPPDSNSGVKAPR